ncbi:hypothetical protein Anapl_06210 [Anas platyrhynchos]|uniref:Uncharacterized protein n=1 Tax=Anas platyrhynchos TaxID=8839 RepID=R0L3C4_ANAPL|nr:hypothetical protein Anapl_06210 [Anas platyrhynchos]
MLPPADNGLEKELKFLSGNLSYAFTFEGNPVQRDISAFSRDERRPTGRPAFAFQGQIPYDTFLNHSRECRTAADTPALSQASVQGPFLPENSGDTCFPSMEGQYLKS